MRFPKIQQGYSGIRHHARTIDQNRHFALRRHRPMCRRPLIQFLQIESMKLTGERQFLETNDELERGGIAASIQFKHVPPPPWDCPSSAQYQTRGGQWISPCRTSWPLPVVRKCVSASRARAAQNLS